MIKDELINKYTERIMIDYPEADKIHIDLVQFAEELRRRNVSGWISVNDALPKALQTVWLTDGEGWCYLGCLIEDAEGWCWAKSNGVIYIENGEIVSECESEDLDVKFWHELPKLPLIPETNY